MPTFIPCTSTHIPILIEMMEAYYTFDHIPFNKAKAEYAVNNIIADSRLGNIWLIMINENIIGYCIMTIGYSTEFGGCDAFLEELYLIDKHRGHGIGQFALQFVEEQARKSGIQALHLEVERSNLKAQRLYRKSGFVDHDRYLMTKILNE